VLSNSSTSGNPIVRAALLKTHNIMKLDAGTEETFQLINLPRTKISLAQIVENLKKFNGNLIIQIMFIRGTVGNKTIDNTRPAELNPLLKYLTEINPTEVMIYSLDRLPPMTQLEKISKEELEIIAGKIRQLNYPCTVY